MYWKLIAGRSVVEIAEKSVETAKCDIASD